MHMIEPKSRKKRIASPKKDKGTRSTYQHGNLPSALSDVVVRLVAQKGVKNFSVAEAARLTGVSTGAPYRHFTSRDDLLVAVAAQFYRMLLQQLSTARKNASAPAEQLAAMAAAYVNWAMDNPVAVEILFSSGIRTEDHAILRQLGVEAYEEFIAAARLAGVPEAAAHKLVFDVSAVAHGYVLLQANAIPDFAIDQAMAGQSAADAARHIVDGYKAASPHDLAARRSTR
jgi:AcrR family transcriptional regulator